MKKSDLKKVVANTATSELKQCQAEINCMDAQANTVQIELVKRYNQLKQPLFDKRDKLLSSTRNFWFRALQNHPLSFYIVDEEQGCLYYLRNLTIHDEEVHGQSYTFTISFHFNENPFFYNQVLWKTFTIGVQGERSSSVSEIQWKEGFEPEVGGENVNKSRKRKRSSSCRFIKWFCNTNNQNNIEDELRDGLWQNPFTYYSLDNVEVSRVDTCLTKQIPEEIILSSDDEMDVDEAVSQYLNEEHEDGSSDESDSESEQSADSFESETEPDESEGTDSEQNEPTMH